MWLHNHQKVKEVKERRSEIFKWLALEQILNCKLKEEGTKENFGETKEEE